MTGSLEDWPEDFGSIYYVEEVLCGTCCKKKTLFHICRYLCTDSGLDDVLIAKSVLQQHNSVCSLIRLLRGQVTQTMVFDFFLVNKLGSNQSENKNMSPHCSFRLLNTTFSNSAWASVFCSLWGFFSPQISSNLPAFPWRQRLTDKWWIFKASCSSGYFTFDRIRYKWTGIGWVQCKMVK